MEVTSDLSEDVSERVVDTTEGVNDPSERVSERVSGSKVQVRPEWRDLSQLQACFRQVSPELLARVWAGSRQQWGACFDLLSAWAASHAHTHTHSHTHTHTHTHLIHDDGQGHGHGHGDDHGDGHGEGRDVRLLSLDHLVFVLEAEHWPSLPLPLPTRHSCGGAGVRGVPSPLRLPQLSVGVAVMSMSDNSKSGSGSGSDGWSFCGMSSEDGNDFSSDAEDSWVDVMQHKEEMSDVAKDMVAPPRSFLEALCTPSTCNDDSLLSRPSPSSSESRPCRKRTWKPVIVCVPLKSNKRRNVVYMDSDEMLGIYMDSD